MRHKFKGDLGGGEGRERQDPLGYGLWRPEIMANMLHMAFPMAAPE